MNLLQQLSLAENYLNQGNLLQAKTLLTEIHHSAPNHSRSTQLLAYIYMHEFDYLKSIEFLLKLVKSNSASPIDYAVLGENFLELKRFKEAIHYYLIALPSLEKNFELLHNLGLSYANIFAFKEADKYFKEAATVDSTSFELQLNWGAVLKNLGRFEESLERLSIAEKLSNSDSRVWLNKGVTLDAMGAFDQAIDSYSTAIKLNPNYLEAYCNKANSLMSLKKHNEALSSFQLALSLSPDDPDTKYNLSLLQLSQGDYLNGWQNYEYRWQRQNPPKKLFNEFALLEDLSSLEGRHVVVWSEQGLGDTIQFCRYIPRLTQFGAKVSLATHPQLMELCRSLEGIHDIFDMNQKKYLNFDFQIPLLSLPLFFDKAGLSAPANTPYLRVNPLKISKWSHRLSQEKKLKVGLVWSGGFRPDQPELWAVNSRRNIPFAEIARLQEFSDVQFFSLQKGSPAEEELEILRPQIWPGNNLSNFASQLNSFEDTAALVSNLDLVISVDTSTAHLTGAIGKPLWILNRYDSCWRWSAHKGENIWYPNAKLFNQLSPGNWHQVIDEVSEELKAILLQRGL